MAKVAAIEQITATEEEIEYVRQSLKKAYKRILDTKLTYAIDHHIEDKIWRYIFYADIEGIRSKLRHKPGDKELEKKLLLRIESAFKFYRELNSKIKSDYHIEDTKVFGIEQFKQEDNDTIARLLQFNYICLGDLSRYHAQLAMQNKNKKYTEYWALAKTCYLKATDVFRLSGKPYCQLALASISNGNAIDVVWYYCMSLAVKFPSSVARDNMNSFYSKLKLDTTKVSGGESPIVMISQFVESFLHIHRSIMFNQNEDNESLPAVLPITNQLGQVVHDLVVNQDEKTTTTLHILKTTLTRTITIAMISIWVAGEKLKEKTNITLRPLILSSQVYLYTFVFSLLRNLYRSSREAFAKMEDKTLEPIVDDVLLQGLCIWSTFISSNFTALSQHCSAVSTRHRDSEKKALLDAVQSFVSLLVSHPSFPDPVLNTLPSTYPISEDLQLLGVVPLTSFHQTVDFFKEQVYEAEQNSEAKRQVRWGRVREMIKKMADSTTFSFIQYSQGEQKYNIVDENAKRQQQNRFMKALATQRLMEQVSSLEKNVNLDVTVFLDGLPKVKKWANQSPGQSSLEIIVPLEVIDLLDDYKKGSSHMNLQARESNRYLDQKLLETKVKETITTSSLRTQKLSEKLSDWDHAETYWIGEESESDRLDELLLSEHENNDSNDEDAASVTSSSTSNSSILVPTSRRTRDEGSDIESSDEEEVYDYQDLKEEDSNDGETYTFNDVPMKYRQILSCLLYYHSKIQETTEENQPERLALITNDEDLAYWAELFGDPKTRKRLLVKTVNDWDYLISKPDFEKSYEYTWKHR
ncbi:hypothetical protein G6F17_001667 [Rhizopus arrhizus]|nr:hypothetical protein G6F22_008263 [Rhizopus arrhizus]KAG0838513.1 hypothetical protein G6F18_004482 [Rhizopus arrhizus]KAG0859705.1 hypothetical protein G6F17_001667 [Rhizopus arrhizus]KAG0889066.1 hypothetical protein G6F15_001007 [Rhizopus arrhizus]KAG1188922.1 hypothetical protein G6F36_004296 [Rhizopus arrhizus]